MIKNSLCTYKNMEIICNESQKKKLIKTKINKRKRFFFFFFKATQTRKLGIGEGLGGDTKGIERKSI